MKKLKQRTLSTRPLKKRRTVTIIPRQATPPQTTLPPSNFSVLSCNVAGLRGVLNNPKKTAAFKSCIVQANPSLLCLQETKLQESHVEEIQDKLLQALSPEFQFTAVWNCSTKPAKLGYSGVACLLRSDLPATPLLNHWSGFKSDESDATSSSPSSPSPSFSVTDTDTTTTTTTLSSSTGSDISELVASEGRLLTLEFPKMCVVNAYVPNSGQKLKRVNYRTTEWDVHMGKYLRKLEFTLNKPVMLIGDLNVAHNVLDIHNFYVRPGFPFFDSDAAAAAGGDSDSVYATVSQEQYKGLSQLKKQAGCTIEERTSFQKNILGEDDDFVDGFRYFWPHAQGCFTYWSQRAGNKAVNRGLRLDYCVVSSSMLSGNKDGAMLVDTFLCDHEKEWPVYSDHCPVGAIFRI